MQGTCRAHKRHASYCIVISVMNYRHQVAARRRKRCSNLFSDPLACHHQELLRQHSCWVRTQSHVIFFRRVEFPRQGAQNTLRKKTKSVLVTRTTQYLRAHVYLVGSSENKVSKMNGKDTEKCAQSRRDSLPRMRAEGCREKRVSVVLPVHTAVLQMAS